MSEIDFFRQRDIISIEKLQKARISLIGAGSIGSFTALTLAKMGAGYLSIYDEDGITNHNLPNQFFRKQDISQFKVESLSNILTDFTTSKVRKNICFYKNQRLNETVIVATDSMESRRLVWHEFLKQKQCKYLIEARVGAEIGMVYTIKFKNRKNINFYEQTLNDVKESLPCTAKSIIYNVLLIASLICRSYKSIINNENNFPKELIFNMSRIDELSFMVRK